jgi:hypothetical protein
VKAEEKAILIDNTHSQNSSLLPERRSPVLHVMTIKTLLLDRPVLFDKLSGSCLN